jgi:hypothetical protein
MAVPPFRQAPSLPALGPAHSVLSRYVAVPQIKSPKAWLLLEDGIVVYEVSDW